MDNNSFDDISFDDISFDDLEDIPDHQELNKDPFYDKFSTSEQKKRDGYVTTLLKSYVSSYKNKTIENAKYKRIFFYGILILIVVLIAFCLMCISCILYQLNNSNTVEYLLRLIPICITFITLIIGTLNIIVKYVFPEKEEEYITKIVELIQNNDLEHKKENIKCNQNNMSINGSDD